jgi:hypothetical protein
MAHRKISFFIEKDLFEKLKVLFPLEKRDTVINDALRRELERIRRNNAANKILSSETKRKRFSNYQILNALSNDRRTH